MVSLRQIISEALRRGPETRAVAGTYDKLVREIGSELRTLTEAPSAEIESAADERIAEGVARARAGNVTISPGFDGEYGRVSIWPD